MPLPDIYPPEESSPFDLTHLLPQRARSAALRGEGPITMPTAGPPAEPRTSAQDTLAQIVARMNQRPDPSAYERIARTRGEDSDRNLVLALTLGAKGGKSLQPFSSHFMQQAMKDRGDVEIPGGWGTVSRSGDVAWNPAKQQEADLARLTTLYGIQERGENTREARAAREAAERTARADREAYRADLRGSRDEARATRGEAQNARIEDAMQKQYESSTKPYREELDATRKVAQLAPSMLGRRPNAIEQQSLMVLLNKFLDPGSVVREGEFDRVARAQGYVDRASNLMQRMARGEPLSDKLIAEIVNMAQFYEKASVAKLSFIGDEMTRKAEARGLDPANVVIDPYYKPRAVREGGAQPGRGTRDAPIKITPRAAGGGGGKQDTVKVDF